MSVEDENAKNRLTLSGTQSRSKASNGSLYQQWALLDVTDSIPVSACPALAKQHTEDIETIMVRSDALSAIRRAITEGANF
jgi:hypothetical protein